MNFLIKHLNENTVNKINYIFSFRFYNKFKNYKTKKKIIHILTPLHGNMGDQAIVYATNKYLRDNFKDYNILEIYRRDIYKYMKSLKKVVNPEDLIVLIGGGNMVNLWINEEIDRRFVIKNFTNNKIPSLSFLRQVIIYSLLYLFVSIVLFKYKTVSGFNLISLSSKYSCINL